MLSTSNHQPIFIVSLSNLDEFITAVIAFRNRFFPPKHVNAVSERQLNKQRVKAEALDVSWLYAITVMD